MKKLPILILIIFVISLSCGCMTTTKDYIPTRGSEKGYDDHYVIFDANINQPFVQTDPNIDYFIVTFNNESRIIYSDLPRWRLKTPISQPVHSIVDVIYINGTKQRVFEGEV
jgi:hypothetical protein